MSARRREKFLPDEDKRLRELVKIYGVNSWELISKKMENRNPRQCRERWKHYLSSTKSKIEWTKEEDDLLFIKMQELGPKWTKISKFFEGRTDIQIKKRWMDKFASVSDLHLKKNKRVDIHLQNFNQEPDQDNNGSKIFDFNFYDSVSNNEKNFGNFESPFCF